MKSAVLFVALACAASAAPKIFYSKAFPQSVPPYVSVELLQDGTATFKEAPDDEDAVTFKIPAEAVNEIFALAEKLNRFRQPMESGLKVANMGEKLFRWEDGAQKFEAKYNYSVDPTVQLLQDWFERIADTQRLYGDLAHSAKFDKLGVNAALLRLEAARDRKRLVGEERFLPLLDRIVKNDTYLNMARERAASLAHGFRNPPAPAASSNAPAAPSK